MENYHIYDEIGRGKYSVVYKARKKQTIDYVAVKSTEKNRMSKVLNEVKILHKINHKYVLKFHNWYESRNHIWLIFEYCTGGDLLNLITQDKSLPEEAVQSFGLNLLSGLHFLHSQGILYCDLKPANILVDESGDLKLADFGLSRPIPTSIDALSQIGPGSPHYMAPELFEQPIVHSFASDLWSLGVLLYELSYGKPPFVNQQFVELAKMIKTKPLEFPSDRSPEFIELLNGLMQKNPRDRMTWTNVIKHPFWSERIEELKLPSQPVFEKHFTVRVQRPQTAPIKKKQIRHSPAPPKTAPAGITINSATQSLIFSSDIGITPIVCNKAIETIPVPSFKKQLLTFAAFTCDEILALAEPELEKHLGRIYKTLAASNVSAAEKFNVLAYMYTLVFNTKLVNIFINSSLVILLVKMAAASGENTAMKCRLILIIGLLIRFATYIAPDKRDDSILQDLTTQLGDTDDRVRRRTIAAIGELMFYISTCEDDQSEWKIPDGTVQAISDSLIDSDQTVQHYAIKFLCNLFSQRHEFRDLFLNDTVVRRLLNVLADSGAPDSIRETSAQTLVKCFAVAKDLIPGMLEEKYCRVIKQTVVRSGTSDSFQQACLTLCFGIVAFDIHRRVRGELVEDINLTRRTLQLLETSASDRVRAKAALLLLWSIRDRSGSTFVSQCCILGLIPMLAKAMKTATDPYLKQCVSELVTELLSICSSYSVLTEKKELVSAVLANENLTKQLVKMPEFITTFTKFLPDIDAKGIPLIENIICCSEFDINENPDLIKGLLTSDAMEQRIWCLERLVSIQSQLSDTFVIHHVFPSFKALFQDRPPVVELALKLVGCIVNENLAFVGILARLELIQDIIDLLQLLDEELEPEKTTKETAFGLNPLTTGLIKTIVESNEIPLFGLFRLGLVPAIHHALRASEKHQNRECTLDLLNSMYMMLYSACKAIQSSATPQGGDSESHELLLQNQPFLRSAGILMRLTAAAPDDFEGISDLTTRCILLMGQLYGTRFYDILFRVGSAKATTPKRSNLRYLYHALDTKNHKVQFRLLRTVRYALRSRSPQEYATTIAAFRGIMETIQSLLSSYVLMRPMLHITKNYLRPTKQVAEAAKDIQHLMKSILNIRFSERSLQA